MNIQLINEMNQKLTQIEENLMFMEIGADKVAPDMKSTLLFKRLLLEILNSLQYVKTDLQNFHDGKSVKTQSDITAAFFGQMFPDMKDKKNNNILPEKFIFPDEKKEDS